MASFETAYEQVAILAEDFKNNEKYYILPQYSEAQARKDYIDKFFIALGWDVNHEDQKDPYKQEVKVERGVSVHGAQRRADYSFSIAPNYRDPKFFVEAKKPSRQLESGDDYFQAIRYGWNTQNPLVVLTDFEEFHILDSRFRPDIKSILNYCHQKYHYTDYLDKEKFKKIYYLFSREAVEDNSIDNYAAELPKPKGKKGIPAPAVKSFDQAFLDELDETRESLARAFKRKNNDLTSEELTEATQRVIDRLVFIRFLEDKLIEGERHISGYLTPAPSPKERGNVWSKFIKDCRTFDAKYNGIVFKYHNIIDSGNFNPPDDKEFSDICADLSHVNSPYDFNFIPIHILGSIYERFLGKVVHATAKQVRVEEKPEVRKAGGVYYTPQYIVKYIVDNTVGKILRTPQAKAIPPLTKGGKDAPLVSQGGSVDNTDGFGLTPKQISKLRFADISCGSGSFLITVFDTLLEYHGSWYQEHPKEAKADGCILKDGKWILSLRQKRDILINNIYGVDIDYQAVEVTQLSLFLKLLEDETLATAHEMQTLFKERILPDLSKNIVCGNSLIGPDISEGGLFETGDERKINAMNFEDRFPHIFPPYEGGKGDDTNRGFDAIVGNPPYYSLDTMQKDEKDYLQKKYFEFATRQSNIYFFFMANAFKLLKKDGLLSYINERYYFNSKNAINFRQFIHSNYRIVEIVDFKNVQIFKGVNTLSVINTFSKNNTNGNIHIIQYNVNLRKLNEERIDTSKNAISFKIEQSTLNPNDWVFSNSQIIKLKDKIYFHPKLDDYVNMGQGITTGLNEVYIVSEKTVETNRLEIGLLKRYIKTQDIQQYIINYRNLFLILTLEDININEYPNIKKYLFAHRNKLILRYEFKNKQSKWYAVSVPRNLNLFLEATEKIITPLYSKGNKFGYDKCDKSSNFFSLTDTYILVKKQVPVSIKYILGILNSRLMNFFNENFGKLKRDGYYEYSRNTLSRIPIKQINFSDLLLKSKHDKMVSLVDQMLEAKKKQMESTTERDKSFWENKCTSLDRQIDALVYELYGLTEEEIKIVEGGK